ncbi:hypothetical protein I4U23_015543 [Adineta vaga]|nr:hypothetical protein I4U23_015543 [Adineta vaga]
MLYMCKFVVLLFVLHISYGKTILSIKPIKSSAYIIILPQDGTSNVCCDAQITINSIADSRCPSNVQCIWAGQAKVKVTISKAGASSAADLIVGANPQNNAVVTVGGNQYSITLTKVIPYPGDGKTDEPSEAVLQVECL